MADTNKPDPGYEESLAAGYEKSDLKSGPIYWSGAIILIVTIIVMVLMWVQLFWYYASANQADRTVTPLVTAPPTPQERTYSQPPLEVSPARHWAEFKAVQDELVSGYGWADETSYRVRIPVERALELVLERNVIPARSEAEWNAVIDKGRDMPSDSSAGRAVERRYR